MFLLLNLLVCLLFFKERFFPMSAKSNAVTYLENAKGYTVDSLEKWYYFKILCKALQQFELIWIEEVKLLDRDWQMQWKYLFWEMKLNYKNAFCFLFYLLFYFIWVNLRKGHSFCHISTTPHPRTLAANNPYFFLTEFKFRSRHLNWVLPKCCLSF